MCGFSMQLYAFLARIRAAHPFENYNGRHLKVIEGVPHLCRRLVTFANPLAEDPYVTVTESVSVGPYSATQDGGVVPTRGCPGPGNTYTPADVDRIRHYFHLPIRLYYDAHRHYLVCVPVAEAERAMESIAQAVEPYRGGRGLAMYGQDGQAEGDGGEGGLGD